MDELDIPPEYRKSLELAANRELDAAEKQLEIDLQALAGESKLSDEEKADFARTLMEGVAHHMCDVVYESLTASDNQIKSGAQLSDFRIFARIFRHVNWVGAVSLHLLGQLRLYALDQIGRGNVAEGKQLFFESLTVKMARSLSGLMEDLVQACAAGGAPQDSAQSRDEILGAYFELLAIARAESLKSFGSRQIGDFADLFAESGCKGEAIELYDFAIERAYEEAENDAKIADYHLGFYKTDEYREPHLHKKQVTLDAHHARIEEYEKKRASLGAS